VIKAEPISPILLATAGSVSGLGTGLPGLSSFGSYRPPRRDTFEEEKLEDVLLEDINRRAQEHPIQTTTPRTVSFLSYMPPASGPTSASSMSMLSSSSASGGLPSSSSISSGMSFQSPTYNQLPPIKWEGGYFSESTEQSLGKKSQDETLSYTVPSVRQEAQQPVSSYQHAPGSSMHSQSLPQRTPMFHSRPMLYNMGPPPLPFHPGHTSSLSHPPSFSLPNPNMPSFGLGQSLPAGPLDNLPNLNVYIPRTSMYGNGPMSAPAQSDHARYNSIPSLGATGYETMKSTSNLADRSVDPVQGAKQYDGKNGHPRGDRHLLSKR
jgi:hypothetical protein